MREAMRYATSCHIPRPPGPLSGEAHWQMAHGSNRPRASDGGGTFFLRADLLHVGFAPTSGEQGHYSFHQLANHHQSLQLKSGLDGGLLQNSFSDVIPLETQFFVVREHAGTSSS